MYGKFHTVQFMGDKSYCHSNVMKYRTIVYIFDVTVASMIPTHGVPVQIWRDVQNSSNWRGGRMVLCGDLQSRFTVVQFHPAPPILRFCNNRTDNSAL